MEQTNVLVITNSPSISQKINELAQKIPEYHIVFGVVITEKCLNNCDCLLLDFELVDQQDLSKIVDTPVILLQTKHKSNYLSCKNIYDIFDMHKMTSPGMKRGIQSAIRQHHIMHELKEQKMMLNLMLSKLTMTQSGEILTEDNADSASIHDLIHENKNLLEKAKEKSIELEDLARHDILTALPNRFYFTESLHQTLSHVKRHGHILSILLIDLDRFKYINDNYGHHIGDLVLIEAAKRIKKSIRSGDFVARIGGDEFAVIIHEIRSIHAAGTVAWKILNEIDKPYLFEGKSFSINASIGISFYPMFGDTEKLLLETADIAMYEAKKIIGSKYCYATSDLQKEHSRWFAIEKALKHAQKNNEFSLAYQPIFELNTRKLYGFEILMRWYNEDLGSVPPADFIPVAETMGCMKNISQWVIDLVCKQISHLRQEIPNQLKFSINLSPNQLKQENLLSLVNQSLQKYQLDAKCLQFEISEMAILHEHNQSGKPISRLYNLGISQVLDDFGMSASPIEHIKFLPISAIKIDRTFISEITDSQATYDIVDSIISFAKKLNMNIIAEGIEKEEQLNYLIARNCPLGQGFYFSKPIQFDRVKQLAKECVFIGNILK